MKKNRDETVNYINSLDGYSGYVQFSHRPIDKERDIFNEGKKVEVYDDGNDGFIYEAHFCNDDEKKSIQIRQINNSWLISETDISNVADDDMQEYISDIENFNYKIKMAQIWEENPDELCANMNVKKITKVVFTGFVKGESK